MRNKQKHADGRHRHTFSPETGDAGGRSRHPRHRGEGPHGGGGRGGRRGNRLFDYGELRLLVLAMIAEQPRHGYELIRAIEEKFGGSYTPSPGVIYPTLSWLDDSGYASMVVEGDRKSYHITKEGETFLAENRKAADEVLSRSVPQDRKGGENAPAPIIRAMENLKLAMRLRMRQGQIDQDTATKIAAALDEAAGAVERS